MSAHDPILPPASFDFLVLSLRFQGESLLGAPGFGREEPVTNLPAARHTIDLLAMIQEKTRNNLTLEEQRLVENTLTELRFRYIQAFEEEQKKKGQAAAAQSEPETTAEASAAAPEAPPESNA